MAVEEGDDKQGIEQKLEVAVCARLQNFKDQADSLTLESVRRLLEKDMYLEKFALDAHKRFIKQYLEKKMDGSDDCNTASENVDKDVDFSHEVDPKKSSPGDEEIMEDSPIMGVLTPKSEVATEGSSLSESIVKKAMWRRADHFQANSENLTLGGVRRLLEEDLGLEKNTLDSFKKFISHEIDQVLSSEKGAKPVKDVKNKASDNLKDKKSKKDSSEEGSESSHSGSDETEVKVKPRKDAPTKKNAKRLEQPKKRKISAESDLDVSSKKQKKPLKRQKEDDEDKNEDDSLSEDDQPHSSAGKLAQRKEKSTPGYGKKVENLKSIIKACGMSVAPTIYKKAKQVPEEEREAFIVKELEGILSREGLSRNPTEKEIKDCKKRKDKARELEGIDMSNIISSSRRRSTFSFTSPVTPVVRARKDKVDAKGTKKKDNNDEDHKDDNEEEKDDDDEVEEVEDDEDEEEEEDESDEFNEDDNEESD